MLLTSVFSALMVSLGTVNTFGASDTVAPTVKITQPSSGSTLPAGEILVLGTAIDNAGGSGVKKVEVKIDGGAYKLATPQAPGDWSQWSLVVTITTEGSHSIKARATDNVGKQRWQTITITINTQDNIPPAITAPAGISAEATGVTTVIPSLGTPAVTDNLDPSPSVTNNAPPSFSLGSTEITWTATDDSGNSATDTQSVTVSDTTPPSIFAPPNIDTASTGSLTPVDLGESTVTDLVDLSLVVTNDAPQAGFPVGITTVTWTAIDDFGNSGTATQTVTITDSAPSIIAPSDIAKEATGSLTPVDLGYPIVTDNLDPSPSVTNNAPPIGFPVGTTIVTWTATDYSGASATATQTITIVDTTPPSMIPPADFTAEVVGGFTTVNLGTPTVIDIVDPLPTVTNNAPSQGFAPGTHTVVWTASDNYGNSASTTQTVTLTDNTPPSVVANPGGGTYSSPQSVILTASETSVEIFYTIDSSDPISTGLEYSTPLNVDVDTTLKFYAVDASGNIGGVSTQGYTINIADTTAPSILITQPAADSVLNVTDGQILVTGTAFDSGSGTNVVEVLVDSGSYSAATPKAPGDWSTWNITVPVTTGERNLVSRATDNAGNIAWNSINVTINDSSLPPPPPPLPTEELPPSTGPVLHATSISDLFSKIATAAPGQWVELANGNYDNPTSRVINRNGVIVKAETVGGVTITGQSIDITGQGAWMYGFVLKTTGTIDLDGSGMVFKRNTVNLVNTGVWFEFRAPDVVVDHNEIFGKSNSGYTFRNSDTSAVRMKITHNYIHDLTGANSMIVLGHSSMSHWDNFAEIAYNRMENINIGDPEIITFKSSGANFHDNTAITSTAGFAFRQGHNNKFIDNTLIGVGLRLYGHGHIVTGNQFIDDPNGQLLQSLYIGSANIADYPDSSNAYYAEVRDCTFENNIIIKTITSGDIPLTIGHGGYEMPPQSNTFRNNIVYGTAGGALTDTGGSASWTQQIMSGNIVYATGSASRGDMPSQDTDPQLVKDTDGIYRFSANSPLTWTQNNDLLTTAEVGPAAP